MLHDGFVVRRATAGDAEAIRSLDREARDGLLSARGGPQWLEEHPLGPDGVTVAHSDACVLVAEIDGVVVGGLAMNPPDARGVAAVVGVYVVADARELGFGDILLADAIAWARSVGAIAVEGEALPGDRDTKNLYERAGITARSITVYRRIDDD